ncbi:UNVERIFIED_CONTAM: ABC transporter permease subunit [Streptococcus canis]
MRSIVTLTRKELLEALRKHKLLVMITIFVLIGLMSPIGTKYLGEILKELLPSGYVLKVREASEIEAYFQFFKNISQIGLIVLIITTSGLMADELEKRTIVNVLSKGVKREYIIVSKFISSLIVWLISYIISIVIFEYYTSLFWGNEISLSVIMYSNLLVFSYGALIISLNIFLGIISKNKILTIVGCFIFSLIQMFIAIFPEISKLLPISLLSQCVYIIEGKMSIYETVTTLASALILILFLLVISMSLFKRKEIEQ